jgi:hypothetical protein
LTTSCTTQNPGTQTGSLLSEANLALCTIQLYIPITDQERQKLRTENKYFYWKREGYRVLEYLVKACTKLTTVNIVNTEAEEEGQGKESP